jgi:hypothetical protein
MRDEQLSKRIRPRPRVLRVVVSAAERAGIEERAVGAGLSVSAYLRGLASAARRARSQIGWRCKTWCGSMPIRAGSAGS